MILSWMITPGDGFAAVIRFLFIAGTLRNEFLTNSGRMRIYINNKPAETAATTLDGLAREMNLPGRGVAMALGTQMVQRTLWAETALKEGDSVIIIKAACGG